MSDVASGCNSMNLITKPSDYFEKELGSAISKDIAEQINRSAFIVEFPAEKIVLREGEKSSCVYLILQGLVRGYYIDKQGNDITKCFSGEGEFFSSEGLRTGSESSFTIECLEKCKCIRLPYELINQAIGQDDKLKSLINQYYSDEVSKLETRTKTLILMSAEERYTYFCEQYPRLQNRIALRYIASYIGIRAASLSRIRKNLKKSDSNQHM